MRPRLTVALAALAAVAHASPLRAQDGSAYEPAVRAVNDRMQAAVLSGDTAVFAELLAPDYLFITATGDVNTRDDVLRVYATRELAHTVYRADSVRVRVSGDAAVLTAVLVKQSRYVRGPRAGTDVSGRYRSTRVYVHRGGRWLLLSTHESRIGPS